MCFDTDARPPLPPIRGGSVDARDLVLSSRDGTEFAGHAARAEHAGGAGIVVIPDIRGLFPYYEELARRFAEAGVHAVAIDQYGRTAGPEKRREGFDHESHVASFYPPGANEDVAAAVAFLRSHDGGEAERISTVGFCMGGRISLLQAAAGLDLAGVIGFYPWPVGPNRAGLPAPADEAPRFGCPVLAIYGGGDQGIGPEARDAFDRALDAAGVEHRTIVYPDAPHGFFDRRAADWAEASADAWNEVLAFLGVPQDSSTG
jgi:carboxymethylenebutenolidase